MTPQTRTAYPGQSVWRRATPPVRLDPCRSYRDAGSRGVGGPAGRTALSWIAAKGRVPLRGPAARLRGRRHAAIVAMLFVVVTGTHCLPAAASEAQAIVRTYATKVAQNKHIALPDGTSVALAAASSITIHFGHGVRYVVLNSGEAFFQAVRKAKRPLLVRAGDMVACGNDASFDVRRSDYRVMVAVLRGRLQVLKAQQGDIQKKWWVATGRAVSFDRGHASEIVEAIAPSQAIAWLDNRLDFIGTPLGIVVADVNRYSRRPLCIADDDIGGMDFTGTIRLDAVREWLKAMPDVFPVRIDESGGRIVISDRCGNAKGCGACAHAYARRIRGSGAADTHTWRDDGGAKQPSELRPCPDSSLGTSGRLSGTKS